MSKSLTYLAAAGLVFASASNAANAVELYNEEGKSLNLNVEVGAGWFSSSVNYAPEDDETPDDGPSWTEGYFKLGFDGAYSVSDDAEIYGAVSAIGSFTGGDGDAGGLTIGDEADLDLEDAVLGVRFMDMIGEGSTIDLSLGSQAYTIGDGWLINGDMLDAGKGLGPEADRGGAYWLAPRKAFRQTAIAKIESGGALGGDVFYLGSDTNLAGDTELVGFDLRYTDEDIGTFAGTYLRVVDVNTESFDGAFATRKDLNTYSIRYEGSAGIEDLFLAAEGTIQSGDEVEAWAAYGEVGYTFSDVPWAPYIGYRYSFFSGDDPDTADWEGYDPLFYGYSRGYGTWYQGEVAGNYAGPFNSNTGVHNIQLSATPRDDLRVGAVYFNFSPDESTQVAPVNSSSAQEIDFFVEWAATDNLFISPLYGIHIPGSGFEDDYGTDDVNHYFQIIAIATF